METCKQCARKDARIAVLNGIATRTTKALRKLGVDTAQFMPEPWSLDDAVRHVKKKRGR